jgi:hypothetical protein
MKTHKSATLAFPAPIVNPERYLPPGTLHMQYPFQLKTTPCPVNKQNTKSWTERKRRTAQLARQIKGLVDLQEYVSIASPEV